MVSLSQLQDLRLEELLFEDFVKGGQQLQHLRGSQLVRAHPKADSVYENSGHVSGVFPAEEAEVEGEEGVVGLLDEESEQTAGLLIRPVYRI